VTGYRRGVDELLLAIRFHVRSFATVRFLCSIVDFRLLATVLANKQIIASDRFLSAR
jgi:hypothetical protein